MSKPPQVKTRMHALYVVYADGEVLNSDTKELFAQRLCRAECSPSRPVVTVVREDPRAKPARLLVYRAKWSELAGKALCEELFELPLTIVNVAQ